MGQMWFYQQNTVYFCFTKDLFFFKKKCLLSLLQGWLCCFMFFIIMRNGVLAPQPRIEPTALALEGEV